MHNCSNTGESRSAHQRIRRQSSLWREEKSETELVRGTRGSTSADCERAARTGEKNSRQLFENEIRLEEFKLTEKKEKKTKTNTHVTTL